jgi:tripartite-type tricarboxylate transporter receptor subunit TctC
MSRVPNGQRRRMLAASIGMPLAAALGPAFAQTAGWPDRPIRLVLGYPPGGAADGTARPIEPKLQEMLGQPIIFDYRPGAGATIAADFTAKAAPDGYTLHFVDSGPLTILPNGRRLGYDPFESFTPIGMVCSGGTLIVSHPSLQVKNLAELIAAAKARPGEIAYGTSGVGGGGHLAAELLQSVTGIRINHVPYKGGNQAVTDLVGGQVPLLFSSMATAIPHVQGGRINALAVTSLTRATVLPNVPTVAEHGYPGFEASVWFAMAGPAKLPAEVVKRVNAAVNAALSQPSVRDVIIKQGYEPVPGTPDDLAKAIRADYDKWGKVIRDANITFS